MPHSKSKVRRRPPMTYQKWNVETLKAAVADFREGDVELNECARRYRVPKATLRRYLAIKNVN